MQKMTYKVIIVGVSVPSIYYISQEQRKKDEERDKNMDNVMT